MSREGGKLPPRALFSLPFQSHLELVDAHLRLLLGLNMNCLQDGAFRPLSDNYTRILILSAMKPEVETGSGNKF